MNVILQALTIVLFGACSCNGMTLMLSDKQKCFQLDKARDIPLKFLYEAVDAVNPFEFSLYYGNKASSDMEIMKKQLVEREGEIKYTTDNDGIYTFCVVQTHVKPSDAPARLKIVVYFGYDIVHKKSSSSKEEHYDVVNRNLRVLNDMIDLTMTEADYQKEREMEHHSNTLAMNSAAVWWPLCQILMLIAIGFLQMQHLKDFFKKIGGFNKGK
jgi:hypothetical protein